MSRLTYTKNGDYYIPDLMYNVPDEPIGKYGLLRQLYLKNHHPVKYSNLLLSEHLYPHLLDVDAQAQHLLGTMLPQMMMTNSITEELKAANQMEWVGKMNNIKAKIEELIYKEIVYR